MSARRLEDDVQDVGRGSRESAGNTALVESAEEMGAHGPGVPSRETRTRFFYLVCICFTNMLLIVYMYICTSVFMALCNTVN